jgi:hypothetical protein
MALMVGPSNWDGAVMPATPPPHAFQPTLSINSVGDSLRADQSGTGFILAVR